MNLQICLYTEITGITDWEMKNKIEKVESWRKIMYKLKKKIVIERFDWNNREELSNWVLRELNNWNIEFENSKIIKNECWSEKKGIYKF